MTISTTNHHYDHYPGLKIVKSGQIRALGKSYNVSQISNFLAQSNMTKEYVLKKNKIKQSIINNLFPGWMPGSSILPGPIMGQPSTTSPVMAQPVSPAM